jgi:hypothetical protein
VLGVAHDLDGANLADVERDKDLPQRLLRVRYDLPGFLLRAELVQLDLLLVLLGAGLALPGVRLVTEVTYRGYILAY